MAVLKKSLEIVSGDSKTYSLTFTNNSVAINITGWTVYMTVKNSIGTIVITKVVTAHTTPVSGLTQINLTHTETELPVGVYTYDIRAKTDTNTIFTILSGTITIQKTLTEL